jgi:glucose-1-phosphate cytidylyltransferase
MEHFRQQDSVASFVSVKPNLSYHLVSTEPSGLVSSIEDIGKSPIRINGGFFILKNEIFKHIHAGEELVREPFQRLVRERRLTAYEYDGFWMSMDTFKDRQQLEEIYARGGAPWEVWNNGSVSVPSYVGVGA